MKPLIVGECNPYGREGLALFPHPSNSAGARLAKILGLPRADYVRRFDRQNLCAGRRWSRTEARHRARQIAAEADALILLGARVCNAFGLDFEPFTRRLPEIYVLPHPSGLCRIWNEPNAAQCARALLEKFL